MNSSKVDEGSIARGICEFPFCILCGKNEREREKERETVSIPKDNGNGKVGV